MSRQLYTRMFLRLAPDSQRWRVGLSPFPRPVPPPPPPSAARTEEIVASVATVRAGMEKGSKGPEGSAKQGVEQPREKVGADA